MFISTLRQNEIWIDLKFIVNSHTLNHLSNVTNRRYLTQHLLRTHEFHDLSEEKCRGKSRAYCQPFVRNNENYDKLLTPYFYVKKFSPSMRTSVFHNLLYKVLVTWWCILVHPWDAFAKPNTDKHRQCNDKHKCAAMTQTNILIMKIYFYSMQVKVKSYNHFRDRCQTRRGRREGKRGLAPTFFYEGPDCVAPHLLPPFCAHRSRC